ncbi:sensor histidine kinase [Halorhabdus salina]|uniref:sensor histidine kinase n=1 Tax=Halorhabdus salina TaxID=2750670 RepID=UPI0015EE6E45|nr:HAMP domain-containing sensor histidine kinase [Halorhabdus salina]
MDRYSAGSAFGAFRSAIADRARPFLSEWELTPGRITVAYLVFGFVGLYVSDVVFARAFEEPLRSQLQAIKGALEILVTAGFIFALTTASRRQLQSTNRELQRRNDELNVLHRVMRHNLRNDLNVIDGRAEYVETRLADDDLVDSCQTISAKTKAILAYVERTGQIRRINEDRTVRSFDLSRIIPIIVERHNRITDDAAVTLELPETAPVEASHMLSAAIEEVITNAITHSDPETPRLRISVSPRPESGMTAITVEDNGPGMPAHVQRIIKTDEHDQLAHLEGLGLWFVRWTVTDADGQLEIDADEDGTTVTILVPTAE